MLKFDFSEYDEFSTEYLRFYVEEGTSKISLSLSSSNEAKNEVRLLVYDNLNVFRGCLERRRPYLELSVNEASDNAVKGYIPFGEWKVLVERGRFSASAHYDLEINFERKSVEKKWYVGELHTHTMKSDGTMTVEELSKMANERGLDFLFVTDHDFPFDGECTKNNVKIFPGTEITSYKGHALVLGTNFHVNPTLLSENLDFSSTLVRSHGGLIGVAHPFFPTSPYCGGCMWEGEFSCDKLDFVELWNSGGLASFMYAFNTATLSLWTKFLNDGHKVFATSGGDIHTPSDFNNLWLPYHVRSSELSLRAVLNSIKNGKSYASRGNFLFKVSTASREYFCGDSIEVDKNDALIVSASCESADTLVLLTSQGAVNVDTNAFEKKFALHEYEDMRWMSILALRHGVLVAFSNPIFLEANGDGVNRLETP